MSAVAPKKTIRSNKAQIKKLCEYMHEHPDFAAGDFNTPQGAAQSMHQWSQLKECLDELGPARSIEQWKVCWRDQKRKARVEGAAQNRAQNATGNFITVPELSSNAAIVLDTIGHEMALGCGPEESPIGFSGDTAVNITRQSPLLQPRAPLRASARRRRVRKILPPERFLHAQFELNSLIKELIIEVRQSNHLKKEQNMLLTRCSRRGRR